MKKELFNKKSWLGVIVQERLADEIRQTTSRPAERRREDSARRHHSAVKADALQKPPFGKQQIGKPPISRGEIAHSLFIDTPVILDTPTLHTCICDAAQKYRSSVDYFK